MPDIILYPLLVILLFASLLKLVVRFIYKPKEKTDEDYQASIAVIDKYSFFRKGISMLLTQQGFEVRFEASNANEMIELLRIKAHPDIVLISTRLDGMKGVESVKWLQEFQPGVKILVMFMDPLSEHPEEMMEAGAHGCLAKTADPEEIKNAILEVLNKGIYKPQKMHAFRTLNTFWSSMPLFFYS
jgi:DNA-binding NarL/FixJ family response regulator